MFNYSYPRLTSKTFNIPRQRPKINFFRVCLDSPGYLSFLGAPSGLGCASPVDMGTKCWHPSIVTSTYLTVHQILSERSKAACKSFG